MSREPKITVSELISAFDEAAREHGIRAAAALPERPPNSISVEEYSRAKNLSYSTSRRELDEYVRVGTATRVLARITTAIGQRRRHTFYVLKKTGGKGRAAK